jgi:CheY-like chemotaxis protein
LEPDRKAVLFAVHMDEEPFDLFQVQPLGFLEGDIRLELSDCRIEGQVLIALDRVAEHLPHQDEYVPLGTGRSVHHGNAVENPLYHLGRDRVQPDLSKNRLDVIPILLKLKLPPSRLVLLGLLRRDPQLRSIPVVMFSTSTDEKDICKISPNRPGARFSRTVRRTRKWRAVP